MEGTFRALTEEVLQSLHQVPADSRLVIGIAGIPGSGKTTLAQVLSRRLNEVLQSGQSSTSRAKMIGMDGYHFSRAQLDKFKDPEEAHARRGAAFTIDGEALAALVRELKLPISKAPNPILAPSFDHARKDPVPDDIEIARVDKIILLEGLYLHTNLEPWRSLASNCDQLWFVEVERSLARSRIVTRHLQSGICQDQKSAEDRADQNDLPNGEWIRANALEPHKIVISIEDAALQT